MKILALDTSAKAASAAVCENGKILAETFLNVKTTHSQTILPMCEAMLNTLGLTPGELDGFAVSVGPGSFTGLRIGISAVKGLAFAADKPCVGVSTLDALAQNCADFEGIICAVMDARCNQVYNALYEASGGTVRKLTEDRALLLADLLEELKSLKKMVLLVGDGADLCYNRTKEQTIHWRLAAPAARFQRASSVALLAETAFAQGKTQTAGELLPVYLRLPQAQRERLSRGEPI